MNSSTDKLIILGDFQVRVLDNHDLDVFNSSGLLILGKRTGNCLILTITLFHLSMHGGYDLHAPLVEAQAPTAGKTSR
ncbi:unnamed protein product [Schistocephalus solidus]|uniref:Uncharacterized protein n=1 Tax=Schistocephalus solidus TaxID=70667 RepID=A0A183T0T1_SCHSO|nr:unnamed protein product [Schistocephalus solidus]